MPEIFGAEMKNKKEEKTHRLPEERFLPSLLEAASWLNSLGYKIGKSKLYKDKDKGLIFVWADGRVYKSDAELYARKHLVLGKSVDIADPEMQDLEALQREKLQSEVFRLRKQIEKMDFEIDKDRGKFLLRSDFDRELAARWLVFKQSFEQFFRRQAPKLIQLVDGNLGKTPDFLEAVLGAVRKELNEMANTESFKIIFTDED